MFDIVGQTEIPETDNPFILLYVKCVFSGYESLLLNVQDIS